jgi:hypothetical protein
MTSASMAITGRLGKAIRGRLLLVIALMSGGCNIAPAPEYIVIYGAKGTRSGMSITISTPNGTEQHQVGATYSSLPYTFRAGQHGYVSAQNLGESGTITVMLVYRRLNPKPVKEAVRLVSTSTGGASIATVSWLVGDERPASEFPQ